MWGTRWNMSGRRWNGVRTPVSCGCIRRTRSWCSPISAISTLLGIHGILVDSINNESPRTLGSHMYAIIIINKVNPTRLRASTSSLLVGPMSCDLQRVRVSSTDFLTAFIKTSKYQNSAFSIFAMLCSSHSNNRRRNRNRRRGSHEIK